MRHARVTLAGTIRIMFSPCTVLPYIMRNGYSVATPQTSILILSLSDIQKQATIPDSRSDLSSCTKGHDTDVAICYGERTASSNPLPMTHIVVVNQDHIFGRTWPSSQSTVLVSHTHHLQVANLLSSIESLCWMS